MSIFNISLLLGVLRRGTARANSDVIFVAGIVGANIAIAVCVEVPQVRKERSSA